MSRTPRLIVAFALIAVGVVAVDQVTKAWALSALTAGDRTSIVGDLLGLTLVRNSGAALSIATGTTWVFTLAAAAVTVVVIRISHKLGSRGWTVALGLLLGGAVGNLIDRLVRDPGVARGHVVDFIAYGDWFVGNVADIAIVAAAILMGLLAARGIGLDGRRLAAGSADDDAAPDDGEAPDDHAAVDDGEAASTDASSVDAPAASSPVDRQR